MASVMAVALTNIVAVSPCHFESVLMMWPRFWHWTLQWLHFWVWLWLWLSLEWLLSSQGHKGARNKVASGGQGAFRPPDAGWW